MRPEQLVILKAHLKKVYVPHLPRLINSKNEDEDALKNIDRAYSAFALDHICHLDKKQATKAVVDDFDDFGVDGIHYDRSTKTWYFVQAKLKESKAFKQEEALAFAHGVQKLVNGDLSGFNSNVQKLAAQIQNARDHCDHIRLMVAHVGGGLTHHAEKALQDLIGTIRQAEPRLNETIIEFDGARAVAALHSVNAVETVDCRLTLENWGAADQPRTAYYGTVPLSELIGLHQIHGKALFERNIRNWLGNDTEVNASIRRTLAEQPELFQYLNNGVTALCSQINPKAGSQKQKQFELKGFSIINGAQTVATTAEFAKAHPEADLSSGRVMITLIQAGDDIAFGNAVTTARNNQNDVKDIAFAALDAEQERIRRELDHMGIEYAYKVGEARKDWAAPFITLAEASLALGLRSHDPRHAVWMKKKPSDFANATSDVYREIFSDSLNSFALANAVVFLRVIRELAQAESKANSGEARLTYKHGDFAIAFMIAKRMKWMWNSDRIIGTDATKRLVSEPYNTISNQLWERLDYTQKGPLATFKNQTALIPVLKDVMIEHFGLTSDPVIAIKAGQFSVKDQYPAALFRYLADKAPQIEPKR
jgi:hypothetical protein